VDRVTVSEAARILGIKEESVRKRVSRGKLRADKDEGGRLLVHLDRTQTVRDEYTDESVTDRDELLAAKDRIISILENQLSEEREARRRADTIIAQLSQANAALAARVPQIEAPQETSEDSQTVEEEPERAEPHPNRVESPEAVQRSTRRSLWRRIFRVRG
jgi:excisionase family DNA binding protein